MHEDEKTGEGSKSGSSTPTSGSGTLLHPPRKRVENPNRELSDYTMLKIIGTGTFGKVHLSRLSSDKLASPVAIKVLKKQSII